MFNDSIQVFEYSSGNISIGARVGGTLFDVAKVAAREARGMKDWQGNSKLIIHPHNQKPEHINTRFEYSAEELRNNTPTSADIFFKLMELTTADLPDMFDAAPKGDGSILATFRADANAHEHIYIATLAAIKLSRQEGAPVEFEFRGQQVRVTGSTEPADIERLFPQEQCLRSDIPPPPRHYYDVQERFNTEAAPEGSIRATYKNPDQAPTHAYYVASELTSLSNNFGDCAVRFKYGEHELVVTSGDDPKTVADRVLRRGL